MYVEKVRVIVCLVNNQNRKQLTVYSVCIQCVSALINGSKFAILIDLNLCTTNHDYLFNLNTKYCIVFIQHNKILVIKMIPCLFAIINRVESISTLQHPR